MYVVLSVIPVAASCLEAVVDLHDEVRAIYTEHGATGVTILEPATLEPKDGCAGFVESFDLAEDETVLVVTDEFETRQHYLAVRGRVDGDDRIEACFDRLGDLVDVARISRGEYRTSQ